MRLIWTAEPERSTHRYSVQTAWSTRQNASSTICVDAATCDMTRATSEVSPGLFRRDKAADLLPPVLASFLSGVVIVIRPIERYLTSK